MIRALFLALGVFQVLLGYGQPVSRAWLRTEREFVSQYNSLSVSRTGDIYVVGHYIPTATAITKYSREGAFLWHRSLPPYTRAEGTIVDGFGDLYVFGSVGLSQSVAYAAKISSSGVVLWETIQDDVMSKWNAATITGSDLVFTGGVMDSSSNFQVQSAKVALNGTTKWIRKYCHPDYKPYNMQEGTQVIPRSKGGVWVKFQTVLDRSEGREGLLGLDSNGNLMGEAQMALGLGRLVVDESSRKLTHASGSLPEAEPIIELKQYTEAGQIVSIERINIAPIRGWIQVRDIIRLHDGGFTISGAGRYRDQFNITREDPFLIRIQNGSSTPIRIGVPGFVAVGDNSETYFSGTINGHLGPQHSVLTESYFGITPPNVAYQWQERVWGAPYGDFRPSAAVTSLEIDPFGDVIVAGRATLAGSRGFVAKYRCNPVSVGDVYSMQAGDTLRVSSPGLLGNDFQKCAAIAILDSDPAHGQVSINDTGAFEYIPNNGFAGVDRFMYRASNTFASSVATIKIRVNPEITYCRFTPASVKGGVQATLRVGLSLPVAEEMSFSLVGGPPQPEAEPALITFTAGSSWSAKSFATEPVSSIVTHSVTVRSGTSTRTATLTVTP